MQTAWGLTRIMGELKKLGITPPSRNTVKNILKGAGLDPGPKRGVGTWNEFLKIHAATLWQCDFFSVILLGENVDSQGLSRPVCAGLSAR